MAHATACTRAVRAGIDKDRQHGAVTPPLHLSSNFSFVGFNHKRDYDYSRSGNPTRDLLAEALTTLEQGAGAVVTSSGMAAVALALELVPAGGRVLAAHDCYGGTWRLLEAWAKKGRFSVRFADLTDSSALVSGLAESPSLVWVETPSNPLLRITDIRNVVLAAHAVGALCVVDNTFLSPALQQPLALGADVVVHSTTKYINGHSDVVGGAAIARTPEVAEKLKWWGNCLGLTGAPFDSWLTLRGLRIATTAGRCARRCRLRKPVRETAMTLKLYGHPFAAFVWKPLIAAYERGVRFEFCMVDAQHPGNLARMRELSPTGQFPALTDGDREITQSNSVIEYLDRFGDAPTMIPVDPDAALEARTLACAFDAHVAEPMQAIVAEALRPRDQQDPHRVAEREAKLDQACAWLARRIGSAWATGERFTIADCAAAPALFYADWVHPLPEGALKDYRTRLLARASVARVVDEARPYRPLFPLGAPHRD